MTVVHEVKSWTYLFQPLKAGKKKHDIRDLRDRDYKVGDILRMKEFDPATGKYTGSEILMKITYMTSAATPCAFSSAVLDRNFAILSLELYDNGH